MEIIFGIAVAGIIAAFIIGMRIGTKSGRNAEAQLADARSMGMRTQLNTALESLVEFRQKAERLPIVEQKLVAEMERYASLKDELGVAFKAAAGDALRANTESFLAFARQELGHQSDVAKNLLETKEQAIGTMLQPLGEALERLGVQTQSLEVSRAGAYSEIHSMLESLGRVIPDSVNSLRSETAQLVSALRAPKTRGNWGEMQLRRCVEFAGMVSRCSFSEQVSTRGEEDNVLRPDMTINLPNGRVIIVDAKTPLDAFLDATSTTDPNAQAAKFLAHAERVKVHLKELAAKAYWKQFQSTPEFVVCFLPSEALFSAALEADPALIELGAMSNVVMATPTTLIALLKAVAYGWQQSQVTRNAKAIQEAGQALYSKLINAHEYIEKVGSGLSSAVGQYNKLVGAIEGRGGAFSQARKLAGLIGSGDEIDTLELFAAEPRPLTADDWGTQLLIGAESESSVQPELAR